MSSPSTPFPNYKKNKPAFLDAGGNKSPLRMLDHLQMSAGEHFSEKIFIPLTLFFLSGLFIFCAVNYQMIVSLRAQNNKAGQFQETLTLQNQNIEALKQELNQTKKLLQADLITLEKRIQAAETRQKLLEMKLESFRQTLTVNQTDLNDTQKSQVLLNNKILGLSAALNEVKDAIKNQPSQPIANPVESAPPANQ
ncbi:MAG: hypothetical protein HQL23_02060 [Candidatus Omnitrophica bacterium]|nr:hypothetical protein [Candidatus Omnitrophota bacterium]